MMIKKSLVEPDVCWSAGQALTTHFKRSLQF